jgi:outer membrane protein assembly factor BamB
LLLSLLLIGGIGYFYVTSQGGTADTFFSTISNLLSLGQRTIIRPVTLLSAGGDGLEPDLLIMSYQLSGSPIGEALATPDPLLNRGIPIILSATTTENGRRTVRWEKQLGTDEENKQINYVVGETAVYVTINDRLYALDKTDGRELWTAALSDAVGNLCAGCMQVVDNTVVLLTVDNVLQRVGNDGMALWGVRLNDEAYSFSAADRSPFVIAEGQIAIIDSQAGQPGVNRAVTFLDMASGEVARRFAPEACGDSDLGGFSSTFEGLNAFSSSTLIDASQDRIYFLSGGTLTPFCLQAWQLSNNQLLWSALMPEVDNGTLSFDGKLNARETAVSTWLFGEDNLYINLSTSFESVAIAAFNPATGKQLGHIQQADYGFTALAEVDGTLFARATRLRGTQRDEIWGITADLVQPQWQYPLLTSELLGVDSSVGGDWSYYAVPNGLALLQLVPAPDRVLAQVISSDGQVLTEGVSNVGDSFWLYTTWTNDTAYMVIRDLFEVNLASGQTKREWP